MSYQVIARKYRPQRFADVVGQEHVTQTLRNAIQQNRIAHAYLFVGPRGTGKTTIARIFSKALNCTGGPKADFGEDDPRCQEITEGRSLDVIEIDGASNRGIEEIRELRDTVKYAPATSRFKIYIIDEVHMLTKEAFNALLKTLEEPPAHVKFMFATTEPEKILPTILSRCQRFDLRRIPNALIVEHLGRIAQEEKIEVEEAALQAIARGADGGMRDAESALDQLISFCGQKIAEADVLSMFGLTAQGQILSLARAILEGAVEKALRELDDLSKNGKDLGRLLSDLLNHFRNLLIFQITRGDLKLLEISETEAKALAEQAALATGDVLTRVMEVFTDYEARLRDATSKKILIEVALLKAIEARNAVSIDQVLAQLREMRAGKGEVVSIPVPDRPTPPPSAPFRAAASIVSPGAAPSRPVPGAVSSELEPSAAGVDLAGVWSALVESVGRVSPFTKTYLLDAHPVSFARNILTIGFDPRFPDHIGMVDNPRNQALLQSRLQELGHPNCQVRFVQADAPAPVAISDPAPPSPASAPQEMAAPVPTAAGGSPLAGATRGSGARPAPAPATATAAPAGEDFKNDPLIQKALEIFRGQIVDVRTG